MKGMVYPKWWKDVTDEFSIKHVKPEVPQEVKTEEAELILDPETEHILHITVHDATSEPNIELDEIAKKVYRQLLNKLET